MFRKSAIPLEPDLRLYREPHWKEWQGWVWLNLLVWSLFVFDVLT
jgi:hypothetical protein